MYSNLDEDEKDNHIPFAISHYATSENAKKLLRRYISDLKNGVCRESLGIDFGQMSKTAYWLGKCAKLKRDMEAMGDVPMKAHGFVFTVIDFSPETTVDLYRAIEANLKEIAELVGETDSLLMAAPFSLYGHYYRYQKSLCDPQPVAKAHGYWKRKVGCLTYDLLKDRQVFVVAEFLKQRILRHTLAPSVGEIAEVDFEEIRKHLTKEYWDHLPDEFPKCCARFHRFSSWEGDILRLNHDQWGNYLFQFFHQLTPAERQAFIELDLMLELIHDDMQDYTRGQALGSAASLVEERCVNSPVEERCVIPAELATPETMRLWKKAQKAGYVDEHFQPLISKPLSAVLAAEMARRLNIRDRWKPFELLWNRKNMFKDFYDVQHQKRFSEFQKKLKDLFD